MNKTIKSSRIKPLSRMTKSELSLYIDTLKHEIHVLKLEGRVRFNQTKKVKEAILEYVKFMKSTENQTEKKEWK